jgi:hypothetical protein
MKTLKQLEDEIIQADAACNEAKNKKIGTGVKTRKKMKELKIVQPIFEEYEIIKATGH